MKVFVCLDGLLIPLVGFGRAASLSLHKSPPQSVRLALLTCSSERKLTARSHTLCSWVRSCRLEVTSPNRNDRLRPLFSVWAPVIQVWTQLLAPL